MGPRPLRVVTELLCWVGVACKRSKNKKINIKQATCFSMPLQKHTVSLLCEDFHSLSGYCFLSSQMKTNNHTPPSFYSIFVSYNIWENATKIRHIIKSKAWHNKGQIPVLEVGAINRKCVKNP